VLRRLLTLTVWALSTAGGLAAIIAPHPAIRGTGVAVAVTAGVLWAHRVTAEHFAAVAEENEAWAGTRHVVFGASEEATHAQVVAFRRQVARTRARLAARRRRRSAPVLSVGFAPAATPPPARWLQDERWWPHGAVHNRR
jgi:hypothetical protein